MADYDSYDTIEMKYHWQVDLQFTIQGELWQNVKLFPYRLAGHCSTN